MPTVSPDAIGELPLVAGLSTSERATVAAALHPARFASGAAVMTADQPGEVAYVIAAGTLRVSVVRADGSEAVLALLGPGEILGELSLLDGGGRSADVVALEPSVLYWFDRTAYLRLRAIIPGLSDNLVRLLVRRLRLANSQILGLATLDVPGRVAHQLLALADIYGIPAPDGGILIDLRLTQGDLAALCGATRARVNQVLIGFKERRYVADSARHRVVIVDRRGLEAHCA